MRCRRLIKHLGGVPRTRGVVLATVRPGPATLNPSSLVKEACIRRASGRIFEVVAAPSEPITAEADRLPQTAGFTPPPLSCQNDPLACSRTRLPACIERSCDVARLFVYANHVGAFVACVAMYLAPGSLQLENIPSGRCSWKPMFPQRDHPQAR